MTAHNRKLTHIIFDLDGAEYQKQITSWTLNNNTGDATVTYTFEPGEEFADAADDEYSLDIEFVADWTSAGISTFLWEHDGEDVPFTLDHHPDTPAEHVRFSGDLKIKAPAVGGEVKTTEATSTTFTILGKPLFARV